MVRVGCSIPGNEREGSTWRGWAALYLVMRGNHMARVGCSIPGDEREPHGEGGLLYNW